MTSDPQINQVSGTLQSLTSLTPAELRRATQIERNRAKNAARTARAIEAEQPTEYGPAMKALVKKQRQFVLAYVMYTNCNATEAARMAGYVDNGNQKAGIRASAHRLFHDPRIGAAIREVAIACAGAEAPIYLKKLSQIAKNDKHKDQVKALGMVLNRVGIPETMDRNINVNVTITTEQKTAEIRQMAAELGLDPKTLLGSVSDAEFTDVSTETGDE